MEGSDHPSNPTVNEKLGMLNDDNVDDDDCWAGYHFEQFYEKQAV